MNKYIEYLWNSISFPETALLAKRVPKKLFLENSSLVSSDKKIFRENVKLVSWEYTLKPSTCPVLPFKDKKREYVEIAVLQVELVSQKGLKRIAEIVHRIIPYPLMLGFYTTGNNYCKKDLKVVKGKTGNSKVEFSKNESICGDRIALSIAPKRFSRSEQGAFVSEQVHTTNWMTCEAFNENEVAFIESLAWSNMPIQTFATLYDAWTDRFTGYECSIFSGTFTIGKSSERIDKLNRCREIEIKVSELRKMLKKESFNRQVELNLRIKKYELEFKQLAANL